MMNKAEAIALVNRLNAANVKACDQENNRLDGISKTTRRELRKAIRNVLAELIGDPQIEILRPTSSPPTAAERT